MQMQWSGVGVGVGGVENNKNTLALQVLCPELGATGMVVLPRSALVSDLKREACAELGVTEEEVMLFDYFGGQCYAALEDRLNATISAARLMDRQAVLLKGKDGKSPSPVSLACLTGYSKPPDMLLQFDDNSQLAVHRCILELSSLLLQDILAQSPATLTTGSRSDGHAPSSPQTPPTIQTHKAHGSTWQSPPVTPSHAQTSTTLQLHATNATTTTTTHNASLWTYPGAHCMNGSSAMPHGASHRLSCATVGAVSRPRTAMPGYAGQGSGNMQGMGTAANSMSAMGQGLGAQQGVMTHPPPLTLDAGKQVPMEDDQEMFVLRVPGDERYSWVYCLQLLYPCCQMRRPPITWSNIMRILALADKWMITSVLRVCEDFLLLPNSQMSTCPSDPAYVWRWLITADRLNMPLVVRKCIAFVQIARVTSGYDRQQLDKAVGEVVALCSPAVVTQLITSLCAFKDELQAAAK